MNFWVPEKVYVNLLRNCQICFQHDGTVLQSYQERTQVWDFRKYITILFVYSRKIQDHGLISVLLGPEGPRNQNHLRQSGTCSFCRQRGYKSPWLRQEVGLSLNYCRWSDEYFILRDLRRREFHRGMYPWLRKIDWVLSIKRKITPRLHRIPLNFCLETPGGISGLLVLMMWTWWKFP